MVVSAFIGVWSFKHTSYCVMELVFFLCILIRLELDSLSYRDFHCLVILFPPIHTVFNHSFQSRFVVFPRAMKVNALAQKHSPEERHAPNEGRRRNLATTPTTKVNKNMASPTNPQRESVKVIGKPPPGTHYTFNYPHPSGFSVKQPALHSTPKEMSSGIPLETFAASNQQLVMSLAKQSLPKCHPDLFDGDVTMFQSWKRSFRAMIRDADVTADQKINYLRNYTNGEPQ